jgi:hypothetical protein
MENMAFGGLEASLILTLVMSLIFKVTGEKIPDRFRPVIAVGFGLVLSFCYIPYNNIEFNFHNGMDAVVKGLVIGLTSVGMYEVGWKTPFKPRK